jgi:uncharacterized membrane protein YgcG
MHPSRSVARLLVLFFVTMAGLLLSPAAVAEPPFRLQSQVSDVAGALSASQKADVTAAVDRLYDAHRIKLWVVYVDTFDNQGFLAWSKKTMTISDFGDNDVLLAVAVEDRALAFQVPSTITGGTSTAADDIRRNHIEPALRRGDWAGAAIAAADQLGNMKNSSSGNPVHISATALWIGLAVLIVIVVLLWWLSRRRSRRRRADQLAAAKRLDPTDAAALAQVPLDTLDELSRQMVVDVDNAVRTSENELTLAVEEFGATRTAPFSKAVADAKAMLAQAFNVRQILDDAVPETPLQHRDLVTRVVVAAGKADRELEAQSDAFEDLRNLVINAPERLDGLTQQMVALTARIDPAATALIALRGKFAETALASITGNVDEARSRLVFADENIAKGRSMISAPAQDQTALVDTVRAAEGALQQSQTLLDAVDSAATDINRAIAGLPAAVADIQNGINSAATQLKERDTPHADALDAARQAAIQAVADAGSESSADPLGAFTRLTKADADLDRVLENVAELRKAAEQQAQVLEQALFAAQSRVKSVSEFIDTRRGSIGPEARTRLAEAVRHLEAAQAKKDTDPAEATAHANGAASLAAQAQTLANDDIRTAQRAYSPQYSRNSDLGSVIGGIIIGNVLRGGFGGWDGSWGGGRSPGRPTSYGGSSHSSGRSYSGGGGRF